MKVSKSISQRSLRVEGLTLDQLSEFLKACTLAGINTSIVRPKVYTGWRGQVKEISVSYTEEQPREYPRGDIELGPEL